MRLAATSARGRLAVTWFARFAAAAFATLFATAALAQSYPNRPVHLLVPFPPGGGANFVARVLAQLLSARLGQSVVVENRPGNNGNVAGELVARAAADGYTVLQSAGSLLTVNPHLYDHDDRSVQGSPAGRDHHIGGAAADRKPGPRAQKFSRLHRLRWPRQAAAVVWLDRQRQRAPSGDGALEGAGRTANDARALPGRRAGSARRHGRRGGGHVRWGLGDTAGAGGQAARARHQRPQEVADFSRSA